MRTTPLAGSYTRILATAAFILTGMMLPTITIAQATATTCQSASCTGVNDAPQPAAKFVPLADYQRSAMFTNAFNSNSLPQYFNNVFTIVLSLGAIMAVLRITYAGYVYMGSADMWGNKQQAKEMLGDAIVGLLLLFGIYLILYQINPGLLNLDVLSTMNQSSGSTGATASPSAAANTTGAFNAVGGPAEGSACNGNTGTIRNAICVPN